MRQGLFCKPFRYYLEYVAPEILFRYPLESRGHFARGAIQSKADAKMCVQVSNEDTRPRKLILKECKENIVSPGPSQMFTLTWHRNIQHDRFDFCIVNGLVMNECHFTGGNQLWKYDIVILLLDIFHYVKY
jgi:polypeptide N-acetylgalactosaminyltransferase